MRRPVHLRRQLLAVCSLLLVSGCNYIHFGRIDRSGADAALTSENADLRLQKKMLQQELAIAHKEGDTLRSALERQPSASGGAASKELVAKLNETTRELAALRADYARLKDEREKLDNRTGVPDTTEERIAAAAQIADLKTRLGDDEDKLASTLQLYTNLQAENSNLRNQIDRAHAENATLSTKVARITAQNDEARAALAQLNTELVAEKDARTRAEQSAEALRVQLRALTEHRAADTAPSLASAREGSAAGASAMTAPLRLDNAPDGSSATAMLTTSPEKIRAAAAQQQTSPAPAPAASAAPATTAPATGSAGDATTASPVAAPAPGMRIYVVRPGDTLEGIAEKFYGRRDRWSLLYAANNSQLSGGRPIKPGMQLEIPDDQ